VRVPLLARVATSPRTRALLLLWRSSRPLSVAAVAFVIAEGALPVLVLVAMGRVTGAIPGAVEHGLSSPAGHRLLVDLAEAGAIYALSLLRGPVEDAITAVATARVDAVMQRRLVSAVCAPAGIEHLEDREVLGQLASARGELLGSQPAGAPVALVSKLGDRLTGVLACAALAIGFHWWLGLGLLGVWLGVRRPLADGMRLQASRVRSAAEPMRRSWYMLGLAWKPPAAKEVRMFGLGDWIAERHRDEWLEGIQPGWDGLRRLQRGAWVTGGIVLVTYAVVAGWLGWAGYHHQISLRTLATMLPMLPTSMAAGSISYADIGLEQLLSALPDLDSLTSRVAPSGSIGAGGAPAAGLPRELVSFDHVGFTYPGAASTVLSDLELELHVGHSLGLVGVNGAGKTTLVTLLTGMREATAGRITVDGRPLDELSTRQWQRQVAVVYQDFARLPLSAGENVGLFGDRPAEPALLERAAEQAGAADIIASLPRGWDTILSPHYAGGVDLSGGQWQRIALARALYAVGAGARVLVLDEPTAQLDVRGEAAFYARFLELTAGVTSIVISHRFASVRRADSIAVLDGGRITELGTHERLLATGGTYAHMFRLQAERVAADSGVAQSEAGAR
jgi:ATP-binding cassette, subfamily B, bacterial